MKIIDLVPDGEPVTTLQESTPNPHQRILVVDDDLLLRRMMVRTLLNSGYQMDTAEDGSAAWEALQTRHYDLLITDYAMPKITGLELLHKMRAARIALPVIMVSGAMPVEELQQHAWLKYVVALAKPFSSEALLATVKEALSARYNPDIHPGSAFPFTSTYARQFLPPPRWGLNE